MAKMVEPGDKKEERKMKTSLRIFFGILIAVLLFFLLKSVDFKEIYLLFIEADNLFFLFAFISFIAAIMIFNLRSLYFVNSVAKTGFWFNFKVNAAGNFINMITPGAQLGGEPVRAYYIGERYNASRTKVFGVILAERVVHAVVSIFFITLSIIYILTFIPVPPELKIIFQTVLFLLILVFVFIGILHFEKTRMGLTDIFNRVKGFFSFNKKSKGRLSKVIGKHFGNFTKTFIKTFKNRKLIAISVALSIVYWLLYYLISYFLFLSFGVSISFFLVLVVVSLSTFVGDFSPGPGGIGLMEGFMIVAYSLLGIDFEIAVAVSILSRVIFYIYALPFGGISLVHLESSTK